MDEGFGVTLIAWSFDEGSGFGAARYAGGLLRELGARGIRTRAIDCGGYPKVPWDPSWRFTWYFNLRVLSRIPQTPIYHYTMDRPAYSIPVLRRLYKTRSVVSLLDTRYSNPGERESHFLRSGCLKKAVAEADLLIATSSKIREDLVGHFSADPSRVREIPLAVGGDLGKMPVGRRGPFTIGYLGRFEHHNNVAFLIRAFSALKRMTKVDARLVLCGVGPQQEECRRLAATLGLKDVEFRGFIPGGRVAAEYNSFDLFVFPSMVEGFGLPIIEAQACGVPVMVLGKASIPEEVARFCMKARDEGHAAQLMLDVMEKGYAFPAGHAEYMRMFSSAAVTEATLKVYQELLE